MRKPDPKAGLLGVPEVARRLGVHGNAIRTPKYDYALSPTITVTPRGRLRRVYSAGVVDAFVAQRAALSATLTNSDRDWELFGVLSTREVRRMLAEVEPTAEILARLAAPRSRK